MAIDRAVLLPGQELMERMDREYERTGDWKPRAEVEKIMREEAGNQEEGEKDGQDLTQAQEMREKMHPDTAITKTT